jgi:hypothetical protein
VRLYVSRGFDVAVDKNAQGCATLEDSFRKYTEVEVLDGDNQYDAEQLGKQVRKKG